MRILYFSILLIFFISSCYRSSKVNEYTAETAEALIIKAEANQLSQEDYFVILSQLDGMFDIFYTKAQQAKEKGIPSERIRKYLSTDAEYIVISKHAVVLDSVLNKYIKSPKAPKDLRIKYFQISSQAAKRAHSVGLD